MQRAFVGGEESCVAAYANARIVSQSPAVISCFGAIQEPPMLKTLESWSHCLAFFCVMPPVGQNRISEKGDAKAWIKAMPPAALAGKNLQYE